MNINEFQQLKQYQDDYPDWFLSADSLTKNLIALNQGQFSVKKLKQVWRILPSRVAGKLRCAPRSMGIERQVLLYINDQPVIFAQTWMPYFSIRGDLLHIKNLQNNSLGAILFTQASCKRSPLHLFYRKIKTNLSCHKIDISNEKLTRESTLTVKDKPFLITESYLPPIKKGIYYG